jgi:SNF2 family DNA or RNA helicase
MGGCLADDMGLGKTVQATAACHALYASKSVKRGLVVVPASLKGPWQREWESFTDAPLTPVEGTPAERARLYGETERGFLILNYELLLRDLNGVLAWDPELVVLDEAQRIKNWATKTAICVKRLRPRHRLVLTGTPFENRLDELASVMDWIDDGALQPKWRLAPLHMDAGGARHLDTLRDRLAPSMLRRRRPEILRQLPERTDTIVPVDLTEAQRDAHDDLNRPIAVLVKMAKRRPLSPGQFLRLMMLLATQRVISNGMAQLHFDHHWPDLEGRRPDAARLAALSSPKLGELREIVRSLVIEQGRKVVVFSQWRRMLALAHWAIGDLLEDAGHKAVFFTGRESPKQRTRSVVELHDDPATTVLFSTDAGGVGLNLQRAATCCINLELPWNPAVLEQRIARIHRLGQKHPIDVVNLVSLDCIESHIAGLVADKKALFDGLFDGDRDEVAFDRSTGLVGRLERVLDPALLDAAAGLEEDDDAADLATEALVAAADEARDGDLVAAAAPPVASVSGLLGSVRIEPRPDGGLRIEAPPEAAEGLRALFEGMARLMAQASAAP